jgi:hypothetical protein
MFRDMVEERLRDRQVFSVDTTPPEEAERERHKSMVLEEISASLGRQLDEMGAAVEQPAALDPAREFGGLGSATDLLRHVDSLLLHRFGRGSIGDLLSPGPIFTGDVTISPPYNDDWQSGGGFAFGAVNDGSLITYGSQGSSVAGVNLYLTSNVANLVSATITPVGTWQYSWTTFENLPTLQTRGGLGVSIHHEGSQAFHREFAMWSQSGAAAFTGQTAQGEIIHAASAPSGPFGPIELGQIFINMQPGVQYLFSLWVWQVAQYPEGASFLGFMSAKMPSVKLSVGPPVIIH